MEQTLGIALIYKDCFITSPEYLYKYTIYVYFLFILAINTDLTYFQRLWDEKLKGNLVFIEIEHLYNNCALVSLCNHFAED